MICDFTFKIFIGNLDLEGTSKNLIVDELQARYLRIHPLSWHNGIALRVEIFAVEIEGTAIHFFSLSKYS